MNWFLLFDFITCYLNFSHFRLWFPPIHLVCSLNYLCCLAPLYLYSVNLSLSSTPCLLFHLCNCQPFMPLAESRLFVPLFKFMFAFYLYTDIVKSYYFLYTKKNTFCNGYASPSPSIALLNTEASHGKFIVVTGQNCLSTC